jgi:Skp family chaperone for outer membrane proteins
MKTLFGWLLMIGCVLTAHAQAFGVVDYERVFNESTYVKTNRERLQALEARYGSVLQTLQENIVLTNEERQELTNLLLTENPNDEQRKRIEQLTQTARQRASELQQLRQKPQPRRPRKPRWSGSPKWRRSGAKQSKASFNNLDNSWNSKPSRLANR